MSAGVILLITLHSNPTESKQVKQTIISSTKENNPPTIDGRLALRIPEVAQALGISKTSVRRLIKRGHLKPLRILRHVLVPVEQLSKLVNGECS